MGARSDRRHARLYLRAHVLGRADRPLFRGPAADRRDGSTLSRRALSRLERWRQRHRACPSLDLALASTTDPYLFHGQEAEAFARVRQAAKLTRYGYDCYAYAMIAAGYLDCVVESGLKPFDIAALIPIIRGAGGDVVS